MKLRLRERFICCLFVAILFLSGMCVELPPADVSFLHAKETSVTNTRDSVIRDASTFTEIECVCTIAMLRQGRITHLSNKGRTLARRFQRDVAVLLAVTILLSILLYYGGGVQSAFRKPISSHAIIVRYIQQMDGKK